MNSLFQVFSKETECDHMQCSKWKGRRIGRAHEENLGPVQKLSLSDSTLPLSQTEPPLYELKFFNLRSLTFKTNLVSKYQMPLGEKQTP